MSDSIQQYPSLPLPPEKQFPDACHRYVHENVFLFGLLPREAQSRLLELVPRFIAGKYWEGCSGLKITDEIRVTIAAQACLLVLGMDRYCFEELKTILVYPGGYLCIQPDALGDEEYRGHHLGEAHHGGPVVLSWWHSLWGGKHRGRQNLVLHEFAHKLAESGDWQRGLPPLDAKQDIEHWQRVFDVEYDRLLDDAAHQRPSLLDPYGAVNRNEFFAVATECFFLHADEMLRRHPELYRLLADWYRQEPAQWRGDNHIAARTRETQEEFLRHSVAECSVLLRRLPDKLEAYRQRAEDYCKLQEYDKAIEDCTYLIERVAKWQRADAYYERGRVHFLAGSLRAALSDFEEAIRREPDFAQAYRARGAAHARRGDHAEAVADFTRALQLDPEDDAAHYGRGQVWREKGDNDKALRDLTHSIRLFPYRAEVYLERSYVHLALGQDSVAFADCTEALRLDPDCAEAYRARAAMHDAKGEHLMARRDYDEAIQCKERCGLSFTTTGLL